MSETAKPENSDYGTQTLKLSGFFSKWSESLEKEEKNGTVGRVENPV
jgi:uncharacterized protein YutD